MRKSRPQYSQGRRSWAVFKTSEGQRYEAYCGHPIVAGNPGNIHAIFKPGKSDLDISANCMKPGCLNSYPPYGTLDGKPYKIQADIWSGSGAWGFLKFNINVAFDIVAPQCINSFLRNEIELSKRILANLIARFTSSNYINKGSTCQLGQIMFCMRVFEQDSTNEFRAMEKMLWSLQDKANGWLPNGYSGLGVPRSGHNPENQDGGSLAFQRFVRRQDMLAEKSLRKDTNRSVNHWLRLNRNESHFFIEDT